MSCVRPLRGETAVQATVRKMSDIGSRRLAMRIVDMLGMHRAQQTAQRARSCAPSAKTDPVDSTRQSSLNSIVSQRAVSS